MSNFLGNWKRGLKLWKKRRILWTVFHFAVIFHEEEAFQQWDISEAYYFEGRDDYYVLEDREESYLDANERDIFLRRHLLLISYK